MIVVDTNIIAYLYLSNERSAQVDQLLKEDAEWIAPLLWRSELRNILALYIRKNILSLKEAQGIMEAALLLMKNREYEIASLQVLGLAKTCTCSAYDCEFIALAQDMGVQLVTADKKILREFPSVAISLDEIV